MDSEKQLGFKITFLLDYTTFKERGNLQHISSVSRKASMTDIIFLVDGFWSIGIKNFMIMHNDQWEDEICVGVIQHSVVTYTEFLLNTFYNKNDSL